MRGSLLHFQHLQYAVIQQEESLCGEDNNIESPCCIVSLWQPRGRKSAAAETVPQSCTGLHQLCVYLCVK